MSTTTAATTRRIRALGAQLAAATTLPATLPSPYMQELDRKLDGVVDQLAEEARAKQQLEAIERAQTLEERVRAHLERPTHTLASQRALHAGTDDLSKMVDKLCAVFRKYDLVANVEELDERGYTIIPPEKVQQGLDELGGEGITVAQIRDVVLRVAEQRSGIKPDYDSGRTHNDMASPAGQHLFYMLYEDPIFEKALLNPLLQAFMHLLLGEDRVLSSSTSFIKGPGNMPLPLHADTANPGSNFPTHANCAYLLAPYKGLKGGSTCFIPGSHRIGSGPWLPDHSSPEKMGAVPVEAPFGSLLVWHGALWHGAYNMQEGEHAHLRVNLTLYHCQSAIHTQERYRETVTNEMLERNSSNALFAQLMGQRNHNNWQQEGPTYEPGVAATIDRERVGGQVGAANVAYAEQAEKLAAMKLSGMEVPHEEGAEVAAADAVKLAYGDARLERA